MKRVAFVSLMVIFCAPLYSQKKSSQQKSSQQKTSQQKSIDPAGVNLENINYPFPVNYINTSCQWQQLKMEYMDVQSDKPNGKTVLLLHGKNFNGAYWENTAKELKNKGYRVIIPDQLGFGKSTKPRAFQYSFRLMALQTKNLLDSLNIGKTIVIGHSMGGMLATRFALMYPDVTEKLVLEDPLGMEDYESKISYVPIEYWYKNELKQDYNSLKKYQQENYYHGTWRNEYEKWVMILARWTMNQDYSIIAWNSALTYDMIMTQPVVYEFSQLKMPTLLMVGELDKTAVGKNLATEDVQKTMGNCTELAKETADKIKGAKLIIVPKTGHIPHLESFDIFFKHLAAFLSE